MYVYVYIYMYTLTTSQNYLTKLKKKILTLKVFF